MRAKPHRIGALETLLFACLLGAAPTTQHSPPDPLASLQSIVAQKASGQSVTLILRPDASSSSAESPLAVAAVREAVIQKLTQATVNVTTSDDADKLLRDSATAGPLSVALAKPVLAAAQTDLLLSGTIRRAGDLHRIDFALLDARHSLVQLSVLLKAGDLAIDGDDMERANQNISKDVSSGAAEVISPLQSAGVKTLLLTVQSDSSTSAGTAGFEMALYDSAAGTFEKSGIAVRTLTRRISQGPIKPSMVASLKDLSEDSAVAVITYAHRRGGVLVKISVVSPKAELANVSVGLDNWDVAAMPALPVLNIGVLKYAEAQRGKKVGNGECWTLAAEALNSAGARPANGYTFGRKLAAGEVIVPGDIFQFTSAKFEGHSGGGTWWVQLGMPNHTAIVRRVLGSTRYEILEQNPGPVKTETIDFQNLKSGSWEAWRAQGK